MVCIVGVWEEHDRRVLEVRQCVRIMTRGRYEYGRSEKCKYIEGG